MQSTTTTESPPYFTGDIAKLAKNNTFYRRVLFTTPKMQLVVQCLKVGDDVDMEKHTDMEQSIHVVDGHGLVMFDLPDHAKLVKKHLHAGSLTMIPRDVTHQIVNTSEDSPLRFYTIYSKSEHAEDLTQQSKYDLAHEGFIILFKDEAGTLGISKFASKRDSFLLLKTIIGVWFLENNTNKIFQALVDARIFAVNKGKDLETQRKAIRQFIFEKLDKDTEEKQ